jgi:hypothetical protein
MIKDHLASIEDATGIALTEEQAAAIDLNPRFMSIYAGPDDWDTLTREVVADILARTILGRPWPTYGAKDESFFDDLIVEAPKKGYSIPQYRDGSSTGNTRSGVQVP